jgi:hypothetical protein
MPLSYTLKMEAASSSETDIPVQQITRHRIQQDNKLHTQHSSYSVQYQESSWG